MFHMQSTYLLKLTVRLRIQFVSVSPLNVCLGQTCIPSLKLWGSQNIFRGPRLLFLSNNLKKFSWQKKFGGAKINLRGIDPECPRGYRPDFDFPDTSLNRHHLTKQSIRINEV